MIQIYRILLLLISICTILCEDDIITLESLKIQPKCQISYSKTTEFVNKLIKCFKNDERVNEEYKN